ncbi:hypothetical protein PTRG_06769 [Pyrenophora tritici-repentis Pt-1C-BFP]|uniref:Uncharacterized protein n=1 Tax=Pyrenophora tritici-repentis (strain Pt-1C-BFP) TaxID=426418 RepID=B2W9W1_PYRTR|nr:uncharacterized protein PTRG_06769 [Pyrenophora tritici-repentis Pt-1C-BFP]EDU49689.1 hypothetical protein PTRG_06769 [Pyrenophora tritici-repentis Pt-1C-BFP]
MTPLNLTDLRKILCIPRPELLLAHPSTGALYEIKPLSTAERHSIPALTANGAYAYGGCEFKGTHVRRVGLRRLVLPVCAGCNRPPPDSATVYFLDP